MLRVAFATGCLLVVVAACSSSSAPASHPVASAPIGPAGGTVTTSGVTLTIPAGALPSTTVVGVDVDPAGPPAPYDALSPLFRFTPDGLTFSEPVTVTFAASASSPAASVYWSSADGYSPLPTTWSGTTASAIVHHFSGGFVGLVPDDGGAGGDGGADATVGADAAVDATPGADGAMDATAPTQLGGPGDPCDTVGCQVDFVCSDGFCASVTPQSSSPGTYCDNVTAFCDNPGHSCVGASALACDLIHNQCACACICGATPCSNCPAQTLPAGAACADNYSPDPSTGLFDPTCILGLTCVSGTCQLAAGADASVDATSGADASVDATPGVDAAVDAPVQLGGAGDPCSNTVDCMAPLGCSNGLCTSAYATEGDYCDNETVFCAYDSECGGARYALGCALSIHQCACECTCGTTPCSTCPVQTLPAGAACAVSGTVDPTTGLFDPTCIIGLNCVSGTCQ